MLIDWQCLSDNRTSLVSSLLTKFMNTSELLHLMMKLSAGSFCATLFCKSALGTVTKIFPCLEIRLPSSSKSYSLFGSHRFGLGIPDRASKRLFHTSVLRPKGGTKHCEASQKILSASACRYLLFWVNSLWAHVNTTDAPGKHLDKICQTKFNFVSYVVGTWGYGDNNTKEQ